MKEATILFPHQLFKQGSWLKRERPIYLVEDQLYFKDDHYTIHFHRKKLIYHRSTMKAFASDLEARGFQVIYLDYQIGSSETPLIKALKKDQIEKVHLVNLTDFILEKRLNQALEDSQIKKVMYESPMFICSSNWLADYFDQEKKPNMVSFYTAQRKRFNILVHQGKPVGGKWSLDAENRKKMPKNIEIPPIYSQTSSPFLREASKYVKKNFTDLYGEGEKDLIYPLTHQAAEEWLDQFLIQRFVEFGPYEDAMMTREPFLFHSVLTPMLNIGLLTPSQVIEKVLYYTESHNVPLNSVEGYIRQILGWREFMHGVYVHHGVYQRTSNFWKHTRAMPHAFYEGTTGIEPVDTVIKRLLHWSYTHHIERLMIIGNFMLLCEIHPTAVYQWFMELYIDAYDWVMVPNIYGMSQYADGGLITTKPYFSSSNYVLKMSNYKKGEWSEIWNGLFWRFIHKHQKFLSQNLRLNFMVKQMQKMEHNRLHHLIKQADDFLDHLQ